MQGYLILITLTRFIYICFESKLACFHLLLCFTIMVTLYFGDFGHVEMDSQIILNSNSMTKKEYVGRLRH